MTSIDTSGELDDWALLEAQLAALCEGEPDFGANAANFAALLFHGLSRLNWVGFYWCQGEDLVLGPFQGRPACTRIPSGRGVCGTAAARGETQRVADVHAFEDHIVCDPASRSELVVPLLVDDRLIGVLDIDSPVPDRFSAADQAAIERLTQIFLAATRAD
jgi:GAF domain-containing protein